MLVIKCIEKYKDKNGVITHYKIQDSQGEIRIVTSKQLKTAIQNKQVDCANLALTSNNRLIDKKRRKETIKSYSCIYI